MTDNSSQIRSIVQKSLTALKKSGLAEKDSKLRSIPKRDTQQFYRIPAKKNDCYYVSGLNEKQKKKPPKVQNTIPSFSNISIKLPSAPTLAPPTPPPVKNKWGEKKGSDLFSLKKPISIQEYSEEDELAIAIEESLLSARREAENRSMHEKWLSSLLQPDKPIYFNDQVESPYDSDSGGSDGDIWTDFCFENQKVQSRKDIESSNCTLLSKDTGAVKKIKKVNKKNAKEKTVKNDSQHSPDSSSNGQFIKKSKSSKSLVEIETESLNPFDEEVGESLVLETKIDKSQESKKKTSSKSKNLSASSSCQIGASSCSKNLEPNVLYDKEEIKATANLTSVKVSEVESSIKPSTFSETSQNERVAPQKNYVTKNSHPDLFNSKKYLEFCKFLKNDKFVHALKSLPSVIVNNYPPDIFKTQTSKSVALDPSSTSDTLAIEDEFKNSPVKSFCRSKNIFDKLQKNNRSQALETIHETEISSEKRKRDTCIQNSFSKCTDDVTVIKPLSSRTTRVPLLRSNASEATVQPKLRLPSCCQNKNLSDQSFSIKSSLNDSVHHINSLKIQAALDSSTIENPVPQLESVNSDEPLLSLFSPKPLDASAMAHIRLVRENLSRDFNLDLLREKVDEIQCSPSSAEFKEHIDKIVKERVEGLLNDPKSFLSTLCSSIEEQQQQFPLEQSVLQQQNSSNLNFLHTALNIPNLFGQHTLGVDLLKGTSAPQNSMYESPHSVEQQKYFNITETGSFAYKVDQSPVVPVNEDHQIAPKNILSSPTNWHAETSESFPSVHDSKLENKSELLSHAVPYNSNGGQELQFQMSPSVSQPTPTFYNSSLGQLQPQPALPVQPASSAISPMGSVNQTVNNSNYLNLIQNQLQPQLVSQAQSAPSAVPSEKPGGQSVNHLVFNGYTPSQIHSSLTETVSSTMSRVNLNSFSRSNFTSFPHSTSVGAHSTMSLNQQSPISWNNFHAPCVNNVLEPTSVCSLSNSLTQTQYPLSMTPSLSSDSFSPSITSCLPADISSQPAPSGFNGLPVGSSNITVSNSAIKGEMDSSSLNNKPSDNSCSPPQNSKRKTSSEYNLSTVTPKIENEILSNASSHVKDKKTKKPLLSAESMEFLSEILNSESGNDLKKSLNEADLSKLIPMLVEALKKQENLEPEVQVKEATEKLNNTLSSHLNQSYNPELINQNQLVRNVNSIQNVSNPLGNFTANVTNPELVNSNQFARNVSSIQSVPNPLVNTTVFPTNPHLINQNQFAKNVNSIQSISNPLVNATACSMNGYSMPAFPNQHILSGSLNSNFSAPNINSHPLNHQPNLSSFFLGQNGTIPADLVQRQIFPVNMVQSQMMSNNHIQAQTISNNHI